jgi:hypothetical protein
MRYRLIGVGAAVAVTGLGVFVAVGLGGGGTGLRAGEGIDRVAVHPMTQPSGATASSVAGASGTIEQPVIKFFETDAIPIAADEEQAARLPCPRRHTVLGGYFDTSAAGMFLDLSRPFSTRKWDIGVFNASGSAEETILGIVCAKNVKTP